MASFVMHGTVNGVNPFVAEARVDIECSPSNERLIIILMIELHGCTLASFHLMLLLRQARMADSLSLMLAFFSASCIQMSGISSAQLCVIPHIVRRRR